MYWIVIYLICLICLICLIYLIYLIFLIYLIYLIYLIRLICSMCKLPSLVARKGRIQGTGVKYGLKKLPPQDGPVCLFPIVGM